MWRGDGLKHHHHPPTLLPLTPVVGCRPLGNSPAASRAPHNRTSGLVRDTLERLGTVHVHVPLWEEIARRARMMRRGGIVVHWRWRGRKRECCPDGGTPHTQLKRHGGRVGGQVDVNTLMTECCRRDECRCGWWSTRSGKCDGGIGHLARSKPYNKVVVLHKTGQRQEAVVG
jgi:hypothetical protein